MCRTTYDIAAPNFGSWDRCWPSSEHGRMGEMPCPNTTYSWQQRYHCNQTAALNAEAARDWLPMPSAACAPSGGQAAGCQGLSEQAAQYYRSPKKSYVDMMMHYHKKMLSAFADGVYYDNMYFNADYHPEHVGGPGYVADTDVADDGELHAGVGLWSLREMARRSAVLQHSMGKPHTTLMFHMTTVNVVPIVGWATVNYDWEFRMAGDGAPQMDCSKFGLDVCLPHWTAGNFIRNQDFQVRVCSSTTVAHLCSSTPAVCVVR